MNESSDDPVQSFPAKNVRRRRWFQFSLRSLMMLTLLAGLGMSSLVAIKKKSERRMAAGDAIIKAGGWVNYDYQVPANGGRNAKPPGPAWLQTLLGDDVFAHAIDAAIPNRAALEQLGELNSLRRVYLRNLAVSGSSFQPLCELNQLEDVYLDGSSIGDNELQYVREMYQLRYLHIGRTSITDAGLAQLSGLSQLELLDLSYTSITDAGLQNLFGLRQLRELDLFHTRVTDDGEARLWDALPKCNVLR
jgi:Leucine rich repeat